MRVAFLKNVLLRDPVYRSALAEISTPRAEVGQPLTRFLRLKNPEPQPAPADTALTFAIDPIPNAPARVSWVGAVSMTGEGNPIAGMGSSSSVRLPGVAGDLACRGSSGAAAKAAASAPDAVAVADLNYDFRSDVALAGPNGLCLMRQAGDGHFSDVTTATKLPPALLRSPAYGVWAADIDTDGDLDLILAPQDGHPVVLRNNGDGTFAVRKSICERHTRPRLCLGRLRRRRRAGRGFPGRRRRRPRLHQPARRQLPSRNPARRPRTCGRHGRLGASGDSPSISSFSGGTVRLTRLSRNERDAAWKATALTRVDPPPGWSLASRGS